VYVPDLRKVLVLGAVLRQGYTPYEAGRGVMDYLGLDGGFGPQPRLDAAVLVRPLPNGATETVRLDLSGLSSGRLPQGVTVAPGDMIYIPARTEKRSLWSAITDFLFSLRVVQDLTD